MKISFDANTEFGSTNIDVDVTYSKNGLDIPIWIHFDYSVLIFGKKKKIKILSKIAIHKYTNLYIYYTMVLMEFDKPCWHENTNG